MSVYIGGMTINEGPNIPWNLNILDAGTIEVAVENVLDKPNAQTGATYVLVLEDKDSKTIWMDNASANTLTIPEEAAVDFPLNSVVLVMQQGAGQTTIDVGTGVTLNGVVDGSIVINNQHQGCTLVKRGAGLWVAGGDIT